jgi:hypothetical protein
MIWQSCENLRAATLNETMVDQLSRYLAGKEAELCRRLLGSTVVFSNMPPQLAASSYDQLRLNDTIDNLGKRFHRLSTMPNASISLKDWNSAIEEINAAFWDYIEILEASLAELFQQIDQIGFEQWTIDLSDAATHIKDELTHRLDDVAWGIRRLERPLEECYCKVMKSSNTMKVWNFCTSFWKKILDPSLETTAKKCLKFLNFRYGKFVERYVGYLELYDDAEKPLRKSNQFRALTSMDMNIQEKYKQTSFLLHLWELNKKARTLPRSETVRAVRSLSSIEATFHMFKEYLSTIRNCIFDRSRLIKKPYGEIFMDKHSHALVVDQLNGFQNELHSLATTIDRYKHFLIETNGNQKSRWNLSRWLAAKETKQTKALTTLVKDGEQLDHMCKNFKQSLEEGNSNTSQLSHDLEMDITHHLHEMGQPLASKAIMKKHAKAILHGLQKIDEVGSFSSSDVEYTSQVLCKLMRSDWKYHVLYDIPGFQQFFQTHLYLLKPSEDRQHIHRYNAFKKVFQQVSQWIETGDLVRHTHDIELDINDTKSLLQDFLGQVQQAAQNREVGPENKETATNNMKQLLDYLYLFGYFFHSLNVTDPEQRQLRRRFLFADQYFDAIEASMRTLKA